MSCLAFVLAPGALGLGFTGFLILTLDRLLLTAYRLPLNIFTGYLPHVMAVQDMKGTNLLEKNR